MERFSETRYVPLSEKQRAIIIGTLYGDGFIQKRGNSYRLKLRHGVGQLQYMLWKMENLKPFFNPEPIIETSKVRGKLLSSYSAHSLAQFELGEIHSLFYDKNGRKFVSEECLNHLTPLGIAVWYMDDGSYERKENRVRIYTNSFTEDENNLMCVMLKTKFGIEAKAHRKFEKEYNKDYWFLMITKKDNVERFFNLVRPHIVPSMQYKISNTRNDYTQNTAKSG